MSQLPLFVYGTLRPQQPNAHLWHNATSRIQTAVFPHGTLFNLGDYPMLLPMGSQPVQGDLLTLQPAAYPQLLTRLDQLESFDPAHPDTSPYRREERLVQLANGRFTPAWVYLGNPQLTHGHPIIPSGNWLNHTQKTADFWQQLITLTQLKK